MLYFIFLRAINHFLSYDSQMYFSIFNSKTKTYPKWLPNRP